jgi:hypothetical protein
MPETVIGSGRFRPNGTSNPSATLMGGNLKGYFSVAYTATGLYTVTLARGFKFPSDRLPTIVVSCSNADNTATHRFQVNLVGDWNNTTRSFVVQARQEATALAPPSNAGNWISFVLVGVASSAPR